MQTLGDRRGVDEVACTKVADDVFVQVLDLQLHLLLSTQKQICYFYLRTHTLPTKM